MSARRFRGNYDSRRYRRHRRRQRDNQLGKFGLAASPGLGENAVHVGSHRRLGDIKLRGHVGWGCCQRLLWSTSATRPVLDCRAPSAPRSGPERLPMESGTPPPWRPLPNDGGDFPQAAATHVRSERASFHLSNRHAASLKQEHSCRMIRCDLACVCCRCDRAQIKFTPHRTSPRYPAATGCGRSSSTSRRDRDPRR